MRCCSIRSWFLSRNPPVPRRKSLIVSVESAGKEFSGFGASAIASLLRLRACAALFSRKFLRWFGVVPLMFIVLSNLFLVSHPFYALTLVLQAIFYSLALVGWSLAKRQQSTSAATFPFFFVLVNIAAFVGVVQALSGKRFGVWESATLSRGSRAEVAEAGRRRPVGEAIFVKAETQSSSRNT